MPHRKLLLLSLACFAWILAVSHLRPLQAQEAERDAALLRHAIEQTKQGDWQQAAVDAVEISNPEARAVSLAAIRQRTLHQVSPGESSAANRGPAGSAGGGAQADFASLINLIQDTIAPDSWEESGTGEGKISEFQSGVMVDANGVLQNRVQSVATPTVTAAPGRTSSHPGHRMRAVSVNRLERQLGYHWALREVIPSELQYVAGLERIHGVVSYPETGDVVLIGTVARQDDLTKPVSPNGRPHVLLDDLLVHLRHAWTDNAPFGCSIDPIPENLARTQAYLEETGKHKLQPGQRQAWIDQLRENLGMQTVQVFGLDPTTHAARVIVEADYHMKRIAMGLEPGPSSRFSYLEHVTSRDASKLEVLRWWFTLNFQSVFKTEDNTAFAWRGEGVEVKGENEFLNARGEREHSGQSSPTAAAFAERFTKQFADLERLYPIYAELQNQFALSMAATCIVQGGMAEACNWSASLLGPKGGYQVAHDTAPQQVMSIVNHRRLGGGTIVAGVSGGVRVEPTEAMQTELQESTVTSQALERLHELRQAATPPSKSWKQWYWDFNAPSGK